MELKEQKILDVLINRCLKIDKQKTIKLLCFGCKNCNDKICKNIFFNGLSEIYFLGGYEKVKKIKQPTLF